MGRIFAKEIAPGSQGVREILLRAIGDAQHVLGVGQFLAIAAMGVGEEVLHAL